ncbi:MAG: aldehyde dehydrogenase family protein [Ardenticatenales bacterium]|nr:aldehyde dehydrogenase family protein [Ardenticatenales bacterium]
MSTIQLHEAAQLLDETRAFIERGKHGLLINNEWVEPKSNEFFALYDPANGMPMGVAAAAGAEDVADAVAAASQAFAPDSEWRRMTPQKRGELLWKVADLIEAHGRELAELDTIDNGKPYRNSFYGDVPQAVAHFRYYAGWTTKIEGAVKPVGYPHTLNYTRREPLGVCGLIIPWNFPLLMCAWKLAPALACGNTAILKPAEQTPLSALRLGELMVEAGLPAGVVNILTGYGVPTGSALVEHPDVDKISFTGSTEVGKLIMRNAADNLKKVSLELGGKSPNVVFADAEMGKAVKGAMWAVFGNTGQMCTAGSRLFVQRSAFDEFVEGLAEAANSIRVGHGWAKNHLGPVVSEEQLDRVLGYIAQSKENGMELRRGGQRIGDEGYFVEPTIISHEAAQDDSALVREEIFGPVVAVTPFDDWEEVVARANDTDYGLASGIWTQDLSKAHRLADALQAGTVWINAYNLFDAASPFGGYKASGFGREMGKEAIELYTQVKSIWVSY